MFIDLNGPDESFLPTGRTAVVVTRFEEIKCRLDAKEMFGDLFTDKVEYFCNCRTQYHRLNVEIWCGLWVVCVTDAELVE